MGGRLPREGIHVYSQLLHVVVQQKRTQHCKMIIIQFFKKKTLASDLPLESHLTFMYKKRRVCSASISSQSCMSRRELKECTLVWFIIFITSCKMLSSGDIFRLASISLWMTQHIASHSESTSLTRVVKPESCPVSADTPSMHTLT